MRYCIFILFSILSTLTFAQGISVSPSRIFFTGEPGQTVTRSITFTNPSSNAMSFVSRIQDWDRDSTGVKMYYPTETLSQSNSAWLRLSSPTVIVPAGASQTVNLSMQIPSETQKTQLTHSMLFFTQVKEQQPAQNAGFGINVLLEVGIQVYHVPTELQRGDLEFLAFEDRGMAQNKTGSVRKMAVKIKNTGEINKDAYVRFELTDTQSGEEIPIKAIPIAMLPGAQQWVTVDLPGDLNGHFLVVAMLDAGTEYDLKIAEKEIDY